MKSVRFSTHELTKPRQLELWRSWYAGSFDVAALDAPDLGFGGQSEVWKLNGMALVSVSAPPLRAIRPKSLIRRDPTDHWVITIGQAATSLMLENDQISIAAGMPFVLSLGDSFVSQREQDSRLQLNIARDKFSGISMTLDAARGRAVSTPLGVMLAEYIRLLERQLPALTDEAAHNLPQAIAGMVAACVAPSNDRMTAAREQMSATLKDKARRCILQNLRSHRLGAEMLCRELGVSRSGLYRLLESEGGVAQYITAIFLSRISFSVLRWRYSVNWTRRGPPLARVGDEPEFQHRAIPQQPGKRQSNLPRRARAHLRGDALRRRAGTVRTVTRTG
jgi:hypothetical protein